MARPFFQFLTKQDVGQGGVAVEEADLVIMFAFHHVLEHTVQGSDSGPCSKHDEVMGRVVPVLGEQATLRRIGHQLHSFNELSVDEGAAKGRARFLDNYLRQAVLRALHQAVGPVQDGVSAGETEGQVSTRGVRPQMGVRARVERDTHGLRTQALHALNGDCGWGTHGRTYHGTNIREVGSHQGPQCR